ncbi:transposase, partial [Arthrobacter sp. ES3-54]|nr:transposase [Arthrobacter sp. ES3-54]
MARVFSLDARTEFFDLVCAGMSILGAARRVGASGGTGTNWWAESGQMTIVMG